MSGHYCAISWDFVGPLFEDVILNHLACGGPIGLKIAPDLHFMNIWVLPEAFLKKIHNGVHFEFKMAPILAK